MILEVATMKIKPERIGDFEMAFPRAAAVSASTPGYISHELQRCIEAKGKYFYIIRWESIEAHMVNFRQSPRRDEFRKNRRQQQQTTCRPPCLVSTAQQLQERLPYDLSCPCPNQS